MVKFIDAKKIEKKNPDTSRTICIRGGKIKDIMLKLNEVVTAV